MTQTTIESYLKESFSSKWKCLRQSALSEISIYRKNILN
jgi:hypothetical protein